MPTAEERRAIATVLGIDAVKKLRFSGQVTPIGKDDWQLSADLGTTIVQPCVTTLAPVTTRLDETVTRTYISDLPDEISGETEMPEDDTVDALPVVLDLVAVMIEALTLALPLYPRAPDAKLDEAVFTEPGQTPMSDADAKPFAGLAALREQLENKDE
ncbi:MAG: DUF177 domain-containing protein [Pseudomonadota bacterium]